MHISGPRRFPVSWLGGFVALVLFVDLLFLPRSRAAGTDRPEVALAPILPGRSIPATASPMVSAAPRMNRPDRVSATLGARLLLDLRLRLTRPWA